MSTCLQTGIVSKQTVSLKHAPNVRSRISAGTFEIRKKINGKNCRKATSMDGLHERSRMLTCCSGSTTSSSDSPPEFPSSSAEIVQQCYKAIKSAYNDGIVRQRVEIILPLIGATDIDDWPGGIRQQFKAAQPMIEDVLSQLKTLPGLEGPLSAKIIDDADAVGAWSGENLSLVLFPTAETIGKLRKITEATKNLQIIANPQWNTEGNVINDFGVLPWVRQPAMELVKSFQDTYIIKQLRMNGDNTRWMYFHGYGWRISVVRGPKQMTTVLTSDVKPTYKEVEEKLRTLPWTMSSKGLFDRIQAEAEFNRKSLESLPPSNE